jgi:hypothetical protein
VKPFTVTWKPDAQARLARLWADNSQIRQQISDAADRIDLQLARSPTTSGIVLSSHSRMLTEPPLTVLFTVSDADRSVRVFYTKLWDE